MAQITPEDEIIYTAEDRPVSYDDEQHSGAILWMWIVGAIGLVVLVILVITGRIG